MYKLASALGILIFLWAFNLFAQPPDTLGNGRQVWVIKTAPDFVGTNEPKSFRKELPIIQITPNPFKNQAWIRYELTRSSNVTLALYNRQ